MSQKSNYVTRIADMETSERPRERLEKIGAENLKKEELLAILLRTGVEGENAVEVGKRLLKNFHGLAGIQRASLQELTEQRGVGMVKAIQIKAAIELGRRLRMESADSLITIQQPQDVADLLKYEMAELQQEVLVVLLLDTRNHVLDQVEVCRGSVNSSQVRVAEVFTPAIRRNAPNIIVVHNHPGGDATPSPDDVALTRSLLQAGKLLDVDVLDHIVVARSGFVSLKERGLGFS